MKNNWLISEPGKDEKIRVFCFPYAGGGASTYATLKRCFDDSDIYIHPIQLPGRENRLKDPPYTRMTTLIYDLTDVLRPYINQPFSFYGHSMGALIAYELTRNLYKLHDVLPTHLFLSSRNTPNLKKSYKQRYSLPRAHLINELRELGGTKEEVLNHPELIDLLLPTIRSDFELFETYEYDDKPPLSCDVTVLGGTADSDVSIQELLAWKDLFIHSSFTARLFNGDHFYHENYIQVISEIIKIELTNKRNYKLKDSLV